MSDTYPKHVILDELVAHRGASEHAPENTLAAFQLALDHGAKWIEFDVTLAGDDTPIIMHDDTTARCSDQDRKLEDLRQENIKTIDAGAWFAPEYAGETIPYFFEVLDWLSTNEIKANVEIKRHSHQTHTSAFVQPIIDVLNHYRDLWPRLLITSFDQACLEYCHQVEPAMPLGVLFEQPPSDWLAIAQSFGAKTMHCHYQHVDAALLQLAKEHQILTRCYTPKKFADVEAALKLGLTSVIVNSPEQFQKAITDSFNQ